MASDPLKVSYLELCQAPVRPSGLAAAERIEIETMSVESYLALYRRVGEPHRWDSRLKMDRAELGSLLAGPYLHIHVARSSEGQPIGFCEFDRRAFPVIELKNFGVVPEAQGRGIGPRLLGAALQREWESGVSRIWLHTDTWDHPAALRVYERAGFRVYDVRYEAPEPL
jgi:GNAT superfamily N-acetyltransferase